MRDSFAEPRIPKHCQHIRYTNTGADPCSKKFMHPGKHSFDEVCSGSATCASDFHDPDCHAYQREQAAWEQMGVAEEQGGLADKYGDTDKLKRQHDAVEHPGHYTSVIPGHEVIEATEGFNFNLGNALKYLARRGRKGDTVEDLKKARKYLEFEQARIRRPEVENIERRQDVMDAWLDSERNDDIHRAVLQILGQAEAGGGTFLDQALIDIDRAITKAQNGQGNG